ncbi:MAG: hypothetical protein AAFO75_04360 [Pseudomonadota bacterium]
MDWFAIIQFGMDSRAQHRMGFGVHSGRLVAALAALTIAATGMSTGALAEEPTAKPDAAASETADKDPLLAARFAAVDGNFEECSTLADIARRQPKAVWHAHNVYATCEVFAADAVKDKIGKDAYIKRIQNAIGAFEFLLNTPGVIVASDRRRSIQFMKQELHKRIAKAGE